MSTTPKVPDLRLRDRDHLLLVLLAALGDRTVSGRDLAQEVAARTDGRIELTAQVVYSQLHHLARNGLVASEGQGRYRVTDSGRRSLRHRERIWGDYVAAVDAVRAEAPRPERVRCRPGSRRAARSPR